MGLISSLSRELPSDRQRPLRHLITCTGRRRWRTGVESFRSSRGTTSMLRHITPTRLTGPGFGRCSTAPS